MGSNLCSAVKRDKFHVSATNYDYTLGQERKDNVSLYPLHKGSILDHIYFDVSHQNQGEALHRVATCSDDKNIAIVSPSLMKSDINYQPNFLRGHTKAVNRLTFSYDSKFLFSVSRDLTLRQWKLYQDSGSSADLRFDPVRCTDDAHNLNIAAVAVSEIDPGVVYTGNRDYSVKAWDVETGQCKV